jgi:zinc finger MYND domain-containing protein 10
MQYYGSVMSPADTEICIRQLRSFPIEEVGTSAWKDQRESLERLNMCTHGNAVQKTDDFVKSFLLEHDKLGDVLHELLVMEVWRQRVLPNITEAIAHNPTASYMFCAYESVLVNLLECICFYEETVLGFGDDILELIDYCWRQVARLFSEKDVNVVQTPASASPSSDGSRHGPTVAAPAPEDPIVHLAQQLREQRIARAMGCISLLWFVVDRLDGLPLSAMSSILRKNDILVGMAEVLLLQPWIRRSGIRGSSEAEKFQNGSFAPAPGNEAQRVCIPEAHAWFCLHKLLCDAECRRQYPYTQHKKAILLRVRSLLNETLLDQIPALQDVQRALEELSFMEPPTGTEEKFKSTLIIEQVPRLMSAIDTPAADWPAQAARMQRLLTDRSEAVSDAMRMSHLFDLMFADHQ